MIKWCTAAFQSWINFVKKVYPSLWLPPVRSAGGTYVWVRPVENNNYEFDAILFCDQDAGLCVSHKLMHNESLDGFGKLLLMKLTKKYHAITWVRLPRSVVVDNKALPCLWSEHTDPLWAWDEALSVVDVVNNRRKMLEAFHSDFWCGEEDVIVDLMSIACGTFQAFPWSLYSLKLYI